MSEATQESENEEGTTNPISPIGKKDNEDDDPSAGAASAVEVATGSSETPTFKETSPNILYDDVIRDFQV